MTDTASVPIVPRTSSTPAWILRLAALLEAFPAAGTLELAAGARLQAADREAARLAAEQRAQASQPERIGPERIGPELEWLP